MVENNATRVIKIRCDVLTLRTFLFLQKKCPEDFPDKLNSLTQRHTLEGLHSEYERNSRFDFLFVININMYMFGVGSQLKMSCGKIHREKLKS